ncbi:Fc.00g105810.m01.CDS01 [Cosmosporella sp. VM-42]
MDPVPRAPSDRQKPGNTSQWPMPPLSLPYQDGFARMDVGAREDSRRARLRTDLSLNIELPTLSQGVFMTSSAARDRVTHHSPRSLPRQDSRPSERRPSTASSYISHHSPFPPPSKPLPPLPPARSSRRESSQDSFENSSLDSHRFSQSSGATSVPDRASVRSFTRKTTTFHRRPERPEQDRYTRSRIGLTFWKSFESVKKKKNVVHFLDLSASSSILATKHGKSTIRVWSVSDGAVQTLIKFVAYTEPQSRSREYLVRSHAIISESASLIALATKFGRSLEIWNWIEKKCLQTVENSDRWTAGPFESYNSSRSALAIYYGETSSIDLYTMTQGKVPFERTRTIDLRAANLPFLMQYPELAISSTSPLLTAAAGPRPPRPGHPPTDGETLLVAWQIDDDSEVSSAPYLVTSLSQHKELETALPCELATYGSVVVSIWIPASYRVVPVAGEGDTRYNLSPVPVPYRYVLVWNLASNSTRTFRIPNTISCISPDCRYVAYCEASTTNSGGKGCLAILDAITGRETWCWPDRDAGAMESGPKVGFEQFETLNQVTELKFSGDGRFLVVGARDGQCCMYMVQEQ